MTLRPTDYITLMHELSEVCTRPTRFSLYRDGDRPGMLDDGQFSFLFVLQGELVCGFSNGCSIVALTAPQIMAVDKHQLRELRCVGETVILECVMSKTMTPRMQLISKVFNKPCTERITLNSTLQKWCNTMFTDLVAQPTRDNNYHYTRCRELTALLLEYPQGVLGTLYVPLYACSMHCDKCTKLFVRDE